MNWKEIKEKCPKAFQKLVDWLHCDVKVIIEDNELVTYIPASPAHHHIQRRDTMSVRRLYDFFDEQEIGVWIMPLFSLTEDKIDYFSGAIGGVSVGEQKSRTEIEIIAFTKAFEILENKIN